MSGFGMKLGQLALTLTVLASTAIANTNAATAAPTPPTLSADQTSLLEEFLSAVSADKLPASETAALAGLTKVNSARPPATRLDKTVVTSMLPWLRATGDTADASLRPYPSTPADKDYGMKLGIHLYSDLPGSLSEAETHWKGLSNWTKVRGRRIQEISLKWAAGQLWRLEDFGPMTAQGMIDWLDDLRMGSSPAYVLVAYARRLARSGKYVTGFRVQGGEKSTGKAAEKPLTQAAADARYSAKGHTHGEFELKGGCTKCPAPTPAKAPPAPTPVP